MSLKPTIGVLSVFLVILCITSTQCDVSHVVLGGESPVDTGTIEVLRKNIKDYLLELEHGGSPQMQLKQIYSASKQIVTGTLYTVQALLETPDGAKKCQIRVLEKPWIDFCQVRVTCEKGGYYEVTFNPNHISQDVSHKLKPISNLLPPSVFHQEPVTERQNYLDFYKKPAVSLPEPPYFNQFTTNHVQQQAVKLPEFTTFKPLTTYQTLPPQPFFKPQPVYKPPQPVYRPQPLPTLPPLKHEFKQQPVFKPQPVYKPPQPVYKPQPLPVLHDFPIKPTLTPKPLPPKPELNVLPFDQLPQGEALESYLSDLFHKFMIKYDREYIDEPNEMSYRYNVFKENFHTMHEHSKTDRLACDYSVIEFADLTNSEFERILGFDTSLFNATDVEDAEIPPDGQGRSAGGEDGVDLPEHYDQRDENLVTRVKFQGDCGACWAFVTTAVIEGLCAKRTKVLQEFSEQSLIDCDNSNYGCKGGIPPKAMKHIAKRGGLELEAVYPYVFSKSTCHFDPKTVKVKVAGVTGFKKNDEDGMARWLFKNGPILVGINADPLKYYKSGVLNPTPQLCSPKKINHGVTLIGFGVEVNTSTGEKLRYWIAKNQWATRFGEDGYFRIARGKNACGLALWAYSAKLANVDNNCMLNGA